MKTHGEMESGCIDPRFLDLGTSWRRSYSRLGRFTPDKEPPILIGYELSVPQSLSGRYKEEKFITLRGSISDLSVVQPLSQSLYINKLCYP
jgi:hypothetical protein